MFKLDVRRENTKKRLQGEALFLFIGDLNYLQARKSPELKSPGL